MTHETKILLIHAHEMKNVFYGEDTTVEHHTNWIQSILSISTRYRGRYVA